MTSILIANIPSIICACIAGYLAANDKQGWGWFLFVAVTTAVVSFEKKTTKNK